MIWWGDDRVIPADSPITRWFHRFIEYIEVGGRAYFNWRTDDP
jgi:hypothetical protein